MRERSLTREQLLVTTEAAMEWVHKTREEHRPSASILRGAERAALLPFFGEELLDQFRVKEVNGLTVDLPNLPRFNPIGFTFMDTVLLTWRTPAILMHEGVHVVQYQILGLRSLVETYLKQAMEVGLYGSIPLEKQAYAAQGDFVRHPEQPFYLPDRIRQELAQT